MLTRLEEQELLELRAEQKAEAQQRFDELADFVAHRHPDLWPDDAEIQITCEAAGLTPSDLIQAVKEHDEVARLQARGEERHILFEEECERLRERVNGWGGLARRY